MLRIVALAAATLVAQFSLSAGARAEVTVSISCSSLGIELQLCQTGADAWAKETGNKVKLVSTPRRRQRTAGALSDSCWRRGSADIDVFQIDVIWPGILAPAPRRPQPYRLRAGPAPTISRR